MRRSSSRTPRSTQIETGAVAVLVAMIVGGGIGACKSTPESKPNETATQAEQETDVARFRFDWPEGTTLEAEVDREFRRSGGRSKSFHASYTLSSSQADDAVRVRAEPEFDVGTSGTNTVTAADALAAASMIAMPTIVAGRNGAFRSVEDVDATRSSFQKAVRKLNGGRLTKQQAKTLKPLLKEKFMADRARQFWSVVIGTWAGSQMEVGATTSAEATDTFALPMAGRRQVDMELECTLEERLACSEGPSPSGDEGCVRIEMRARPDVATLKKSMQSWVDSFAKRQARRGGMKKAPKLKVTNAFLRTDISLVTEPETLVPHRLRREKTVRLTLKAPSGQTKSYRLVDEERTRFTPQ